MTNEPQINPSQFKHLPVLADIVLESSKHLPLEMLDHGLIIDATLGGGGHSELLLSKYNNLHGIGIDQDPHARTAAKKNLLPFKNRMEIINTNFADFQPKDKAVLIIADLGVSSPQLDIAQRGFSFRLNGPLDMRMNPEQNTTAADLIESLTENQLADIIYNYGEEKFSRRIAKRIKRDLIEKGSYSGTTELAYSIAGCYPPKRRFGQIHPATRTFQALRIAVNNELDNLQSFLESSPQWLKRNGLLLIISFHSLEDRLVKNSFRNNSDLERINRKPITPNQEEISINPRSRSAKLRIARRIN